MATTTSLLCALIAGNSGISSDMIENFRANNYITSIKTMEPLNKMVYRRMIFKQRRDTDACMPEYIVSNVPLIDMIIKFNDGIPNANITIVIPLKFISELSGFNNNKINDKFTYKINWKRFISKEFIRIVGMPFTDIHIIINKDLDYTTNEPNFCRMYSKNYIFNNVTRRQMQVTHTSHFNTIYSERAIICPGQNKVFINTYKRSCIKGIYIEGYNENINEILFKFGDTTLITIPKKVTDNIIELRFIASRSIDLVIKEFSLLFNNDSENNIEIMIRIFLRKSLVYENGMAGVMDYQDYYY